MRSSTPHMCCAAQSVLILILLGELTSPLQNLWYFARYLKDRSQVRHIGGAPAAATRQSAYVGRREVRAPAGCAGVVSSDPLNRSSCSRSVSY